MLPISIGVDIVPNFPLYKRNHGAAAQALLENVTEEINR
jgi:hypothetical protein